MSSKGIKRKLTTILAADVVGYSAMMAADEEATLQTLRAYRAVIDELVGRHDGRLFNTAGDAVLVEFGSAVEAVRCAIAVQEDLSVRNAQLADEHQMRFRMGINVGDVMIEGDDLFGDGVNVAARLEGLADPGGICISGATFEQVKNKMSIGFEDIGPQQVKNIPQPVPSFKLVPGPVSVKSEAAGDAAASAAARRRRPAMAIGAVLVLALAGAAAWMFTVRQTTSVASFASDFSTDELPSEDIEAVMAGVSIQGITTRTGAAFVIRLESGGAAEVAVDRTTGALSGTKFRDSGKWWAENFRFCMQFSKFSQGRKLCPVIVREGPKVTAYRGDGTELQWTFGK